MIKVITASGFECEISETAFDDIELIEELRDVMHGDITAVPSVARRILGDQRAALYDHCRNGAGVAPATKVLEEVNEIVKAVKSGKKS